MSVDEPELFDRISDYEGQVEQAKFFSDVFWMADLVEMGYVLVGDIDRELPAEGLEYRDRVAGLIDELCDAIQIENDKLDDSE